MSKKNAMVTVDAILEILSGNATFMGQQPEILKVQTEFVKEIIEILGTMRLSKIVTFSSLIEANVFFHRYGLDHGMAEKIAAEMKKAQEQMKKNAVEMKDEMLDAVGDLGGFFSGFFSNDLVGSLADMVGNLQSNMSDALSELEEMVKDPAKFLDDQGATELQGLMWIGLSPALAKRCADKKDITIADLLSLEPGTIVNYPGSPAQPSQRKTSKKK